MGKAVASSTPLPRALAFTRVSSSCDSSSGTSGVGGGGGGEGGRVAVGGANRPGGVDVGSVRMVLDFGSGPKQSKTGREGGGGESLSNTPVFGVFHPPSSAVPPLGPSSTVGGGTTIPPAGPSLTPDVVSHVSPSPSWSARPPHFTRQLLTAPVAPKKRVSVSHNLWLYRNHLVKNTL